MSFDVIGLDLDMTHQRCTRGSPKVLFVGFLISSLSSLSLSSLSLSSLSLSSLSLSSLLVVSSGRGVAGFQTSSFPLTSPRSISKPASRSRSTTRSASRSTSTSSMSMSWMEPVTSSMTSMTSMSNFDFNVNVNINVLTEMTRETAEALAGPFFGISLFPYLGFLYLLNVKENQTPKGVTVGFATCLLFVFLTIPAAITAQLQYGVSLADSDWLHGSAESLLTITNLVTVVAFRQALNSQAPPNSNMENTTLPPSVTDYRPMINLVAILTAVAALTALVPAAVGAQIHTPYLNGVLDLPPDLWQSLTGKVEPANALTVACWIIHISSLVEFLVAMGFVWRWADIVQNPTWKGLTWGLLPLHSSGITACTYHLFYNQNAVLVPLQAFLTCVGNTTAMYATYRIALSNGWQPPWNNHNNPPHPTNTILPSPQEMTSSNPENPSLIGFEDLGNALANDNDSTFLLKLFFGCALGSYGIKYGETLVDFPLDAPLSLALIVIFLPSLLNAYKWYRRSTDATFDGWF